MSIRKHLDHIIGLHIVFFLFTFVPAIPVTDTIATGGNITGADTLVSAGGSFTLGFFSPPGEPTKLYLGIWFSFSPEAICWVANRDHPLNDTSGVLVLSKLGTLLLLDGSNNSVWSSGSTSSSSSPFATGARLLESGNLVVQGQDNSTFQWQSFDHPCNVLLAGMKMGKNRWNGDGWYLSSWHSATDPGMGSYRYITELGGGTPENVLRDSNGTKKYRTGPWNGERFDGVPEMASYASDFFYHLTISRSEVTYSYTPKASAPAYSQLKLGEGGQIQRLAWDESNRQWNSFLKQPRDECDSYAFCGPFGLCDRNAASKSLCICFNGFVPAVPKEWSLRKYSGGCRRNVSLDCNSNQSRSSTDGFLVVPFVKLPDTQNASVVMDISLEECKLKCLANCSCVAYAAANVTTGGGGGGSGCIIWTDSFIDLRFIEEGQDFYLRLPKSLLPVPAGGKNKRKVLGKIVASSIGSFVGALALAAIIFGIVRRLITSSRPVEDPPRPAPAGYWIDYQILKDATDDFSVHKEIGQGSFGIVYQCELPPQESTRIGLPVGVNMVAVKKLNQSVLNNFERELQVLFVLSHVNLVRLLAYSSHNTEAAEGVLIYEYMENRSLHDYIFGEDDKRKQLSWTQRLQIITSIANGVWYLHWGCGRHVIHRDLKPANILLADDFAPKIADFGLAKHAPDPTAFHTPVGAYGYLAPECQDGLATKKSDVYSFGVVLLEIITGSQNCVTPFVQRLLYAWESSNTNNEVGCTLEKLFLDEKVPLSDEEKADVKFLLRLRRCIQIGLDCVHESPDERPDILEVLTTLKNEVELPEPEGPTLREQGETSNTWHTNDDTEQNLQL